MAARNDPDYREAARELYRLNVDRLKFALQIQFDYAKWLVATLVAAHSAATFAVATHNPPFPRSLCIPFIVGIVLTLIAGLFSWVNAAIYVEQMQRWADPNMLADDSHWPEENPRTKLWLTITTVVTVGAGILSGACLAWGAIAFERL